MSHQTLNDRLAEYFQRRAGEWVDAHDLLPIAGFAAWRTRLSDLRRAPYGMTIESRVEYHPGHRRSFYKYVPTEQAN